MSRQTTLRTKLAVRFALLSFLIQNSTNYSRVVSTFQSITMTGSIIADIYTRRLNENGETIFVIHIENEAPQRMAMYSLTLVQSLQPTSR